jgi:amino acid transporter
MDSDRDGSDHTRDPQSGRTPGCAVLLATVIADAVILGGGIAVLFAANFSLMSAESSGDQDNQTQNLVIMGIVVLLLTAIAVALFANDHVGIGIAHLAALLIAVVVLIAMITDTAGDDSASAPKPLRLAPDEIALDYSDAQLGWAQSEWDAA